MASIGIDRGMKLLLVRSSDPVDNEEKKKKDRPPYSL
jgi:hypothetical protein